jgi:hypothetical protein
MQLITRIDIHVCANKKYSVITNCQTVYIALIYWRPFWRPSEINADKYIYTGFYIFWQPYWRPFWIRHYIINRIMWEMLYILYTILII